MPKFNKSPFSYPQLLSKLLSRNLHITDHNLAQHHLRNIGYYRLIGYGLPFEEYDKNLGRTGKYKPDTQFDDLLNAYTIDSDIRRLLLKAIEQIEIAIRNIINHELSCKYASAHWYMDETLFKSSKDFKHSFLLQEIKRQTLKSAEQGSERAGKREVFIAHYYSHYDTPELPPSWMIAESLTLGSWSKVYEHLKVSKDRKIISSQLDLPPATLQSWLHSITYLRNMCAHHSRLFGRNFVMRPNKFKDTPFITDNRLFNYVGIVFRILKHITPESNWLNQLYDELIFLDEFTLSQYGFHKDWLENDFWLE